MAKLVSKLGEDGKIAIRFVLGSVPNHARMFLWYCEALKAMNTT